MKLRRFITYTFLLSIGVVFTIVLRSKPANLSSNKGYQLDAVIGRAATRSTTPLRTAANNETDYLGSPSPHTASSSKDSPIELPKLQARRVAHLRKVCSAHPEYGINLTEVILNDRKRLWSFIFNDDLKIVYGSLCKVQSTSWKKVFMVLDGKYERVEDVEMNKWSSLNANLHYLSKLNESAGVEYRLREYTKYLIVREPYSRALSGYRNKLARRNHWFEKLVGRKIISRFRRNPSKSALLTGRGVTFTEFLQHIAYLPDDELDGHWKPMYRMVYPCNIPYDYIGKQETSEVDVNNILERVNLSNFTSSFPKGNDKPSDATDIFDSFYEEIDANLLRDVYWKFLPDIQLFGYELPDLIQEKFNEIGFDYRTARSNLTYFH